MFSRLTLFILCSLPALVLCFILKHRYSKAMILNVASSYGASASKASKSSSSLSQKSSSSTISLPLTDPVTDTTVSTLELPRNIDKCSTVHLIVLVHGWLGNPMEMFSIQESLQTHIAAFEEADDGDDNDDNYKSKEGTCFVVHSAACNEGRTSDGIAAGGSRLANEINQIIQRIQNAKNTKDTNSHIDFRDEFNDEEVDIDGFSSRNNNNNNNIPRTITLSLVGNSLGGLYSRYALGEIDFGNNNNKNKNNNNANNTTNAAIIIPKLFVTTATPHLGVGQNTYLKLPRRLEYPIATVMQQTGRDLFNFSPLLHRMTREAKFVKPLQTFEHRIAYANVYGTDFQVPTATAAFWEEASESEHVEAMEASEFFNNNNNNKKKKTQRNSLKNNENVVAVYETGKRPKVFDDDNNTITESSTSSLSIYLDAMGWTKVLVDVRPHLPSWSNRNINNNNNQNNSENVNDNENGNIELQESNNDEEQPLINNNSPTNTNTNNNTKKRKSTTSARELLEEYGTGAFLTVPLGHTVMVANAKDALNRWITQGGKPIMDSLASSMVDYLSSSSSSSSTDDDDGKGTPEWTNQGL